MTQRTAWGIIHHQKGGRALDGELTHAHNIRMGQLGNGLGFSQEELLILLVEHGMENFDRGIASQVEMLSQVDFRKAPLPQETMQTIVPKPLSFTLWHSHSTP